MDRKKIKLEAQECIKDNVGALFLCALIISVISGVTIGLPLITFVLAPCFSLSVAMIYLNLFDGKKVNFEDIFLGFKDFERSVIVGLLTYVYTFLWSLLFIIPGIVKAYAYSQAYFIIAEDNSISASAAIDKSQEMMMGHKWELFMLDLSFIGWHILGCLTFGLIYIYVIPYMNAAKTNFYRKLVKQ